MIPYDPTYAPAPTNYCTGKLNSLGCVPAISAIGSASATSSAAFSIHATNLLVGKPGLLLVGVGKSAQAFQGGLLCVQPPLHRVGAQNSIGTVGCDGTFRCNMQGHIQNGSLPSLVPGTLAYCQWWSRDPQDPAGYGSSLTDALSFGIAP